MAITNRVELDAIFSFIQLEVHFSVDRFHDCARPTPTLVHVDDWGYTCAPETSDQDGADTILLWRFVSTHLQGSCHFLRPLLCRHCHRLMH
jgi:hypothetical protein